MLELVDRIILRFIDANRKRSSRFSDKQKCVRSKRSKRSKHSKRSNKKKVLCVKKTKFVFLGGIV